MPRLKDHFTVDVDEEGWKQFVAQYPDFKEETLGDTLIREAIAAWDSEGLLEAYGLAEAEAIWVTSGFGASP